MPVTMPRTGLFMDTKPYVTHSLKVGQLSANLRQRAINIWGYEYTRYLETHSPRNTNRYVRGWILAGNTAHVCQLEVPRVVPLSETERGKYIDRLQWQFNQRQARVEKLTRVYNAWYGYKPERKLGTYGRKLKRELAAEERSRDRAKYWLDLALKSDSFIFMAASEKAKRKTETIREKVYGGEGYRVVTGSMVKVYLHNLESHCRILEWRLGLVAKAKAHAAKEMRRRMAEEYRAEIGA